MRIAFVSVHGCPMARLGERDTGGMNVFLREAARELGRRGVQVDIFTRCHDPRDPQVVSLGQNARVVHLEAGPHREAKRSLYQHLPQFIDKMDGFVEAAGLQYDLVHSHYWLSGPVALHFRSRWNVPAVASFHTLGKVQRLVRAGEPDAAQRTKTEGMVVRAADLLISSSPQERQQLLWLYGADPDRSCVVPCGFEEELFRPTDRQEARRQLGLTASKIVLFVGRMEPIKGVDILLRAAASLEDQEGLLVVVVGGDKKDPEQQRLATMARELGIEGRLLFAGTVPQERLPLYYSAADVCVAPSYYETFGLVALEAMACGTPVIAARVGGLQSIVVDGKSGFLVPWHCPEPYAERLEVLLGSQVLRERLGRGARESVRGMTWSFVADRLLAAYKDAVGRASLLPTAAR